MDITFLGSGGAFTDHRINYQNNALIDTAEGPVLLDCGITACQSMRELSVPLSSVRAVLFTHLHADHASPQHLILERFYGGGVPTFQRTHLIGPVDLIDPLLTSLVPSIDVFTDPHRTIRTGGIQAMVQPVRGAEIEIGGVRFSWFRVPHVTGPGVDMPAYGIVIDDGQTRTYWSGDTTLAPGWVLQAADDPHLGRIFHECTFRPHYRGTVHTHFEQIRALPPQVLSRLVIMHHTQVPQGVDIAAFLGAAARHQRFRISE